VAVLQSGSRGCPHGVGQAARSAGGGRGVGAEHGEQDVAASSGEADEGGVVLLSLGSFPVVVGAADGVCKGCAGGEEESAFEFAVAAAGWVFAADAAAGEVCNGCDAGATSPGVVAASAWAKTSVGPGAQRDGANARP